MIIKLIINHLFLNDIANIYSELGIAFLLQLLQNRSSLGGMNMKSAYPTKD